MTPAQTALCAMLFGGMIGSGSVMAVQKAKAVSPKVAHAPKAKTGAGNPGSKAVRAWNPAPASVTILDCPTPVIGSPWGIEPYQPAGLTPPTPDALLPPHAVEQPGGGGVVLLPPSYSPAVPEPGAWAMFIVGFGLVGMAMRKTRLERPGT